VRNIRNNKYLRVVTRSIPISLAGWSKVSGLIASIVFIILFYFLVYKIGYSSNNNSYMYNETDRECV